jgi:hypothetical protein
MYAAIPTVAKRCNLSALCVKALAVVLAFLAVIPQGSASSLRLLLSLLLLF